MKVWGSGLKIRKNMASESLENTGPEKWSFRKFSI